MNLNEIKLCEPIKLCLESMGFKVYYEVPELQRVVDVIALKGSQVIAVDLKTGYCEKGLRQAYTNCLFADKSYIAVKSRPRPENILKCQKHNIGILLVRDVVSVLSEAIDNHPSVYKREIVIESCKHSNNNNIAGWRLRYGCTYGQISFTHLPIFQNTQGKITGRNRPGPDLKTLLHLGQRECIH
jgi:hypothetical protein